MAKRKPLDLKLKKGALHKQLHIPKDEKIPLAELEQAKHSINPLTRKRANFALVARKWKKGGSGGKKEKK